MTGWTMAEAVGRYAEDRRARGEINATTFRNIESRLSILAEQFGVDKPVADLDRAAVLNLQRRIGELRPATRRSYLSTVRVFCQWLVAEGHLATDPTARLARVREPRRVPRALNGAAVDRLIAGCGADLRDLAIVALMLGCGLRCIEVSRLEAADYDRENETLFVRGKAGHERLLPVPEGTAEALDRYLDQPGRSSEGALIRDRRDRRLTPNMLSKELSRLMDRSGLKQAARDGVSAHALRHTCASDVLDRCHDVRTVQELMGHASLATTEIYLRRANMGRLREAMAGRDYVATGRDYVATANEGAGQDIEHLTAALCELQGLVAAMAKGRDLA